MSMAAEDDEDEEQEAQLERAPSSRRIRRDQPALSREQVFKSSLSL